MHYILSQLQKPQKRHYSTLGPLYLKIKVSKMGIYIIIVFGKINCPRLLMAEQREGFVEGDGLRDVESAIFGAA